ncbi:hypothetical protein KIN20_020852 [Parelaphostrongylus tenuis]|uniref:Uncharacterized protein n=1 Tax=Parelaphostrongylus tenuis TaxID=148309 RepID=A0AAD5QTW3_PARTN|nr:hypothetical protein KIN20_020852 [Parelaphostrongylus tenuis]
MVLRIDLVRQINEVEKFSGDLERLPIHKLLPILHQLFVCAVLVAFVIVRVGLSSEKQCSSSVS